MLGVVGLADYTLIEEVLDGACVGVFDVLTKGVLDVVWLVDGTTPMEGLIAVVLLDDACVGVFDGLK